MLVIVLSKWIRSIVNQCKAADIPVYVKQLRTEEAKQAGTHRSDTKGANPQLWAENLRESESFLACAPRRFIPSS